MGESLLKNGERNKYSSVWKILVKQLLGFKMILNLTIMTKGDMMILRREDGRTVGIFDICDWWLDNYPVDIYKGLTPETKEICDVRLNMIKVLLRRTRIIPSHNNKQG